MMRIFLSTIACILLCANTGLAFEVTGFRWDMSQFSNGVRWCPRADTADDANTATKRTRFAAALDAAMGAWTESRLDCSSYRAYKTTCSGSPRADSNEPWVYWESNWGSLPGVGSGTIGITLSWGAGRWFAQALVAFNEQHYTWNTNGNNTDVQTIALHEFGHFIGLDHYDEYDANKQQECYYGNTYPSVMCAGHTGNSARILTTDDILGVCSLYPNDGATGSPCNDGRDCDSGICHEDGYCTSECSSSTQCPTGYVCSSGLCVPDAPAANCDVCGWLPCENDSFCVGNASSLNFCTEYCSSSANCPLGFACAPLQSGGGVCWPLSNACGTSGPGPGEQCATGSACALGNICLGGYVGASYCYKVCRSASDCSTGQQCVSTSDPDYKYCEGDSSTCACDVDPSCSAGCSCDPDCAGQGSGNNQSDCACDVGPGCNANCGCDPECGASQADCACDEYWGCDEGCACDRECICECDEYWGCDEGCACDSECSGCANAAIVPQLGGGYASDLSPLLAILGGLWLMRRRRQTSRI